MKNITSQGTKGIWILLYSGAKLSHLQLIKEEEGFLQTTEKLFPSTTLQGLAFSGLWLVSSDVQPFMVHSDPPSLWLRRKDFIDSFWRKISVFLNISALYTESGMWHVTSSSSIILVIQQTASRVVIWSSCLFFSRETLQFANFFFCSQTCI